MQEGWRWRRNRAWEQVIYGACLVANRIPFHSRAIDPMEILASIPGYTRD